MFVHEYGRTRAPEFSSQVTWLQGGPLSLRELRGKTVLIDFWTYSCVNCLRTLPYIKRWHETYAKDGLVIIGVHTPEFLFEKDESNVRDALARLGITYPVVLDAEYTIWKAYANKFWPRTYLINSEGVIVYDHVGEGAYATTELAIQDELRKKGAKDLPAIGPDHSVGGRVCHRTSEEVYFGFLRGKIHNTCEVLPGEEMACTDDNTIQDDGVVTLHGHWKISGEYAEHARNISGTYEYLRLQYRAYAVNMVIEVSGGKSARLEVLHNGAPLSFEMRGEDIEEEGGKTWVTVSEPRMYSLVKSGMHHAGSLRVSASMEGVRFYAATFGSCEGSV